jgi:hypothetical protein
MHQPEKDPLVVDSIEKLAVLELHRKFPTHTAYQGRFLAYFDYDQASPTLESYDRGDLCGNLRDFAEALRRVRDRIFERERAERAKAGANGHELPTRTHH